MNRFRYSAWNLKGKRVQGKVNADTLLVAREQLRLFGLKEIHLERMRSEFRPLLGVLLLCGLLWSAWDLRRPGLKPKSAATPATLVGELKLAGTTLKEHDMLEIVYPEVPLRQLRSVAELNHDGRLTFQVSVLGAPPQSYCLVRCARRQSAYKIPLTRLGANSR